MWHDEPALPRFKIRAAAVELHVFFFVFELALIRGRGANMSHHIIGRDAHTTVVALRN